MNLLFDRWNWFNGMRADLRLWSSVVWQQCQLLLTCRIACCCCCCSCCFSLVMITTSLLTSTALLRWGSGSGCEQTTVQWSMFCLIHTVLQDQQRNTGNVRNICLPYNQLIFLLRHRQTGYIVRCISMANCCGRAMLLYAFTGESFGVSVFQRILNCVAVRLWLETL
jgi:hypothetical protein